MVHESVRIRQVNVQKTGEEWEDEVISEISPLLNKYQIKVVKGKKKEIKDFFWTQLYIPTKT